MQSLRTTPKPGLHDVSQMEAPTPWNPRTPPPAPIDYDTRASHPPSPYDQVIFGPTLVGRLPELPMTSLRTILELCDTRKLGGIDDLTERLCDIDAILSEHDDQRSLMTLIAAHTTQRLLSFLHGTDYDDPIWVQQCILTIGKRFLRNFYGVLTGATVEFGWERFYRLVNDRQVSLTRAAVSGLTAHLLLDFVSAVAETGTEPFRKRDYWKMTDHLHESYASLMSKLRERFEVDLSDLFRVFFFTDRSLSLPANQDTDAAEHFRRSFEVLRRRGWETATALNDRRHIKAKQLVAARWHNVDRALENLDALGVL